MMNRSKKKSRKKQNLLELIKNENTIQQKPLERIENSPMKEPYSSKIWERTKHSLVMQHKNLEKQEWTILLHSMERNNKNQNRNYWNGNKNNNSNKQYQQPTNLRAGSLKRWKLSYLWYKVWQKETTGTQINKIRSQMRNITIDTKEI